MMPDTISFKISLTINKDNRRSKLGLTKLISVVQVSVLIWTREKNLPNSWSFMCVGLYPGFVSNISYTDWVFSFNQFEVIRII